MKIPEIGQRKYTAYWLSSTLGFMGFVITMGGLIFSGDMSANNVATLGYIYLFYQLVLSGAFFGLNVVGHFADAKKMLVKEENT